MNGCINIGNILTAYAQMKINQDIEFARSVDTSETVVSKKTIRKVRTEIRNYDRQSRWTELPLVWRRIIAAILIVCTVSLAMCLSVEAIRKEIVNTIVEHFEKFSSIFFIVENETPPTEIEIFREPALQFAGTEKLVMIEDAAMYAIMYTKQGVPVVQYQQGLITDSSYDVDNEYDCIQSTVTINGFQALLFTYNDGSKILIWNDGEYAYTIVAFTDEVNTDILLSIAESVQ